MNSNSSATETALDQSRESRKALSVLAQRINGSIVSHKRLHPGSDPAENVKDFVERLDWRLTDDLKSMGANYRATPEMISRRLSTVLTEALDLFAASTQITEHVIAKCTQDWKRAGGPWRKTDALIRLTFRALAVSREVFALLQLGYISGARARLRTLLELAATARLLGTSPVAVSQRFESDHVMEIWRQVKRGDLVDELTDVQYRHLARRAGSIEKRFGVEMRNPRGWAAPIYGRPPSLNQIVKDYGPTSRSNNYTELSHEIHASNMTSVNNEIQDWMLTFGSGPRVDAFAHIGYDCTRYLKWAVDTLLASAAAGTSRHDIAYWRYVLQYALNETSLELLNAQAITDPKWYRDTLGKVADTLTPTKA